MLTKDEFTDLPKPFIPLKFYTQKIKNCYKLNINKKEKICCLFECSYSNLDMIRKSKTYLELYYKLSIQNKVL